MIVDKFGGCQDMLYFNFIPNLYRLVWDILECKSILSARKVPQFDGDLGPNISHKNVSYDKKSYTTTNGMD